MIVYDYNLIKKDSVVIANGISTSNIYDGLFFKCIHFFEEAGVFGYFNNDENHKFIFQFKIYSDNKISDYFQTISEVPISDIFFNNDNVKLCDMLKIEDQKFFLLGYQIT